MRRTLGLGLLVLVPAALGLDAGRQLREPLPLAALVQVEVPKGASFNGVLREWQSRGLITSTRQRLYLSAYARLRGQAGSIKAGEYQLEPGTSPLALLALLVSGKTILHELRVIEGWRFVDLVAALQAHSALRKSLPDGSEAAVMQALERPGVHPEGRFYPDTYRFPRGTTDVEFLQRALRALEHVLAEEWAARAPDLPYANANDALIMASIVERETGVPDERPTIAGVFVRRLQKGMRLQTDPSVIYGLGARFDGNLRKRDLLADGPYNTYLRKGLPPTPICLPGRAAIHAALHPAAGETLYFVSRGDGTHQFSVTFAEHDAAVRRYQLKRRRKP